jgi:23S rRNA pseudouridine955/2504/2580 synthase
MQIEITNENSGRRLDKFLFAYLNNAPSSFIYKMLRKKRIKLNGGRADGSELLHEGDEIRFFLAEETISGFRKAKEIAPAPMLDCIIYEDESLLVVNKPAGLPSQGGMKSKDHLLARILFYLKDTSEYFTPAICNRLDVNTSGLVICGKNLHALQTVNAAFANREVKKEYLAIVHGAAGKIGTTQTLKNFYKKDQTTNKALILQGFTEPEGTTVITEFTVLSVSEKNREKYSLLSVSPITGRSHQIRAHLASIGHPLVGDKKYGGLSPTPFAPAQLLHCLRLEIPALEKSLEAPLPKGFSDCLCEWFGASTI